MSVLLQLEDQSYKTARLKRLLNLDLMIIINMITRLVFISLTLRSNVICDCINHGAFLLTLSKIGSYSSFHVGYIVNFNLADVLICEDLRFSVQRTPLLSSLL